MPNSLALENNHWFGTEDIAAVGDEDAKLALVGRVGSARLLWSYITWFRRSRTGCVMRDVCHCTAPIAALNISTFGKSGRCAHRGMRQGNLCLFRQTQPCSVVAR